MNASSPTIVPRRIDFDFDAHAIPAHWFNDNLMASHAVNGLNLVFPAGERFFIRSVRHFLPHIEDPHLRAEVRNFFKQEAQHGHAHERAFRMLEAQGFELDTWLQWYEKTAFETLEPKFPKTWALSTTAAMEHLTACMAHYALTHDDLDRAHPVMADLLRWHAAEEIEHKAVAFEVLQQVDDRYATRAVGMVLGAVFFLAFWQSATRHLLQQDPKATAWRQAQDRSQLRQIGATGARRRVLKYAAQYLQPGFHPNQVDDYHLAPSFIQTLSNRRPVTPLVALEA